MSFLQQSQTKIEKQNNQRRFKWESEAMQVCKEKYKFYLAKGNMNKANIYKLKIEDKRSVLSKLRKLIR